MKDAKKQYEIAKKRALNFMKTGQLNAYFQALVEMNNYKKIAIAVRSN